MPMPAVDVGVNKVSIKKGVQSPNYEIRIKVNDLNQQQRDRALKRIGDSAGHFVFLIQRIGTWALKAWKGEPRAARKEPFIWTNDSLATVIEMFRGSLQDDDVDSLSKRMRESLDGSSAQVAINGILGTVCALLVAAFDATKRHDVECAWQEIADAEHLIGMALGLLCVVENPALGASLTAHRETRQARQTWGRLTDRARKLKKEDPKLSKNAIAKLLAKEKTRGRAKSTPGEFNFTEATVRKALQSIDLMS